VRNWSVRPDPLRPTSRRALVRRKSVSTDHEPVLAVRLVLQDDGGQVVLRLRLRFSARLPASVVLDALLRRVLAERRRGRSVHIVRAPSELLLLLALCGLDPSRP
jgi:hypothetical protein